MTLNTIYSLAESVGCHAICIYKQGYNIIHEADCIMREFGDHDSYLRVIIYVDGHLGTSLSILS